MFTEQQIKWLKRVEDLFFRLGIKSLTMDDVARELAISKKTLYQFVDNKDDLVQKVIERHLQEEKERSCKLQTDAQDALHEIFLVMRNSATDFQKIKSNILFEMQRFHRDAWEKIQIYQREEMYKIVHENLLRGIREGLYRDNFNSDIIARLHIAAAFQVFDEDAFPYPQYQRDVLFREYMMHYLYGILSEKGRTVFHEYLSQQLKH